MEMGRRALLGAALAVPALGARAEATKLTYTAAPIADNLPVYLARERGIFARHGLDVSIVTGNGTTIPAVLISGGAQIGSLPPTNLLLVNEAGLGIVGVVACDATPHPSAVSLLVGSKAPVKTVAELRGRRLGVPGLNGTFHVLARAWLARNDLDDGSITFVETPYPRMIDALRGGEVDGVTAPRPYRDRIIEMQAGWPIAELVKGIVPDGTINMVHTATRDWATANAATLAAFRASLDDAIEVIHTDPDTARAVLAQYTKLPAEVVATLPFLNYGTAMTPHGLDFWIEESLRQGLITKAPNPASLMLS